MCVDEYHQVSILYIMICETFSSLYKNLKIVKVDLILLFKNDTIFILYHNYIIHLRDTFSLYIIYFHTYTNILKSAHLFLFNINPKPLEFCSFSNTNDLIRTFATIGKRTRFYSDDRIFLSRYTNGRNPDRNNVIGTDDGEKRVLSCGQILIHP